jgi:hypothetical protein
VESYNSVYFARWLMHHLEMDNLSLSAPKRTDWVQSVWSGSQVNETHCHGPCHPFSSSYPGINLSSGGGSPRMSWLRVTVVEVILGRRLSGWVTSLFGPPWLSPELTPETLWASEGSTFTQPSHWPSDMAPGPVYQVGCCDLVSRRGRPFSPGVIEVGGLKSNWRYNCP